MRIESAMKKSIDTVEEKTDTAQKKRPDTADQQQQSCPSLRNTT